MSGAPTHLPLLLEVWREVGRHLEIGALVEAVAPQLDGLLRLRGLRVAQLDPASGRAEVLAGFGAGGAADPELPLIVDAPGVRAVLDGATSPAADRVIRALGWPELGERGWRAVLPVEEGAPGLLLARPGPSTSTRALQDLVEPFAAALANHHRLHELARLREAVEAENRALLTRLERQDIAESVVGATTGLREVMQRVDQVAATDAPVLVFGETGSGKEVVARAIHERSRRREAPFLRVNCGAIPAELIDSELFGHERGSFTGAVATRSGWFERADGGTLFLDELGELPAAAQVRLLRVLQDGTYERVGGQRTLRSDVRIIAATHRDMHALIATGRFREDLWYRISVFPITLPPLRARAEDVPALAAHFAARAGRRLHGVPLVPTERDLRLMLDYDWPGNVRELAAVIERAAILGDGRHLDVARAIGAQGPARRDVAPPRAATTLEQITRSAIEAALQECRGLVQGPGSVSDLLGVNPSTLRSRMKRLGLDPNDYRPGATRRDPSS